MASKDQETLVSVVVGLDGTAISSDTTTTGNIIDTAGYESVTVMPYSHTLTDGTYDIQIEHGNDSGLSDAAVAASTDLTGTTASAQLTSTDDNSAKKLGYVGKKRYVRTNIVSTGTTSGGTAGVLVVLGRPRSAAVA